MDDAVASAFLFAPANIVGDQRIVVEEIFIDPIQRHSLFLDQGMYVSRIFPVGIWSRANGSEFVFSIGTGLHPAAKVAVHDLFLAGKIGVITLGVGVINIQDNVWCRRLPVFLVDGSFDDHWFSRFIITEC